MTFNDFDGLKPLGEGLVSRPNKAFRDYAETRDFEHLGAPLGIWLEKGVVDFLETYHGVPHNITDEELAAANAASIKKIGPLQYRIIRLGKRARIKGHLLGSMHRLRQFRNDTMHGTPELAEKAKLDALAIRNWLIQDYVPLYARAPRPKPATPSPTPRPPPSRPIPAPRPTNPPLSDPSSVSRDPYKRDVRPSRWRNFWSSNLFAWLVVLVVVLSFGVPLAWFSYRVVVAVGEWWASLPTLTQVAKHIPVPSNPWATDSKPTSPVTKPPPTFAERVEIPTPRAPKPPPQAPNPQAVPAPPLPPIQLECPPGTLYDAYTSQCTFLPQDQTVSSGPPLSIHPECPPGSAYSEQSESCVIIEATDACPPDMYRREGSCRCVSKLKYPLFRYEQTRTLLAGAFLQAPPVDESYVVRVLTGSLRVFYAEDPASARNVLFNGHAQPLYNYAILSCVICPATFVTNRMN